MAFGTSASRKILMTMVSLVVALDVAALAIYYALGISHRPNQVQTGFVVVWTLATLGIVLVYMKRIRKIRDAAIGRRRPARP
jgi:FtsH-binding integral membrane protein